MKRQRILYYLTAARLPLKKGVIPASRGFYGALVAVMRPEQFIRLTTKNEAEFQQIMDQTTNGLDKYDKQQYGIPFLDVNMTDGRIYGHEGRHRAAMVFKAGGDKFPVVIVLRRTKWIVSWEIEDEGLSDDEALQSKTFYDEDEAQTFMFEQKLAAIGSNINNVQMRRYSDTMKGSPAASDPSNWKYAPYRPDDLPPILRGQFNQYITVKTDKMKRGPVKGYSHFNTI